MSYTCILDKDYVNIFNMIKIKIRWYWNLGVKSLSNSQEDVKITLKSLRNDKNRAVTDIKTSVNGLNRKIDIVRERMNE